MWATDNCLRVRPQSRSRHKSAIMSSQQTVVAARRPEAGRLVIAEVEWVRSVAAQAMIGARALAGEKEGA